MSFSVEEIKELAGEGAISWDGFDEAIIGHDNSNRLVYDIDAMATILCERDGMEWEAAMEYLEYNVLSTYAGENTPINVYIKKHIRHDD